MIVELAILIIVGLLMVFIFKFVKRLVVFIVNSVLGLLALFGFNYLFDSNVVINVWSILITGVSGFIGFFIVLITHYLGVAF
ncbi:pro-sigmaK processing inhibitor BofA family protein [Candidatus Woesearchaeota archaeon]|nr:pro-sigmaK processing inhibitor BofA family protein [Candidatus Woesearchaeota archaeon]